MVDRTLSELGGSFEAMYASAGRPSIAPKKLLWALLLQIFYSIRSERLLCEQLDCNLLFRWFIGSSMDDAVWDHSTFSKNRDRLLESDIARGFFAAIVAQAEAEGLTSDEHCTVDGTLIEAWASLKSVRRKDAPEEPPPGGGRNPDRNFHGEKRSNKTHASSTDPEAQLFP
jgi:transposase